MKMLKCLILLIASLILVSGCGKENIDQNNSTENNEVVQQGQNKSVEITPSVLTEGISKMTEVTSYVGDTDGDGTDEKVILATSAERNGKGEFLWNDGQNWALYVDDKEEGTYVLYDGFVQAGNVNFEISDYYMKDGAVPKISVIVSTGAGFSLKNYTFNKEKQTYTEEELYDTKNVTEGGINRRFTSIPEL